MGQIFDSLVHALKLVKIKNPIRILQTNPQIPQEWVGPFYFIKNMFCWDTLIITEPLWSKHLNPHCKYEFNNTADDGESSNLDKLGDGLEVYGVDGHGD